MRTPAFGRVFQPVEKVPAPPRASNRQLRLAAISLIISCGLVSPFAGRLYDKMGIKALFVMHPEKKHTQAPGKHRITGSSKSSTPKSNKNPVISEEITGFCGACGRTRTGDLRITNALLYQLSHASKLHNRMTIMVILDCQP